ncbi:unnamed protein product [Calypogeia fissa]
MAPWDPREASPAALETIHKNFDHALLDVNYFNAITSAVTELGFEKENSIALVNSCRDELARPISQFFDENFGYSFNLSGIAGIITAGALGFYAATSHAPVNKDGRAKYLFFGSTHTAVDEKGKEGAVWREGQNFVGNACGAIEQLKSEISNGDVQTGEIRDDNVEYDILKKKIFAHHPAPPTKNPTNFGLTKITIDVITKDLEGYVKNLDTCNADYAVFTGVQIHAGISGGKPGNHLDYIAPVTSYAVLNGKRQNLKIEGKTYVLEK